MAREKSTLVQVRIKDWLLAEVDAAAEKGGMNRSQYIIGRLVTSMPTAHTAAEVVMTGLDGHRYPVQATMLPDISTRYARPAHAETCPCLMCRPK